MVFKVVSQEGKIYALKRVTLQGAEPSAVENYLNEINLLKRLRNHKTIIHFLDAEVNVKEGVLLLVRIA